MNQGKILASCNFLHNTHAAQKALSMPNINSLSWTLHHPLINSLLYCTHIHTSRHHDIILERATTCKNTSYVSNYQQVWKATLVSPTYLTIKVENLSILVELVNISKISALNYIENLHRIKSFGNKM